jgi:hypothetical protein
VLRAVTPNERLGVLPGRRPHPGRLRLPGGRLVLWLRSGAAGQRLELLDAVLVGLGACLVSWVVQVVPALEHDAEPARQVLNAIYPVIDIVLLTLCVRMALTRNTRYPAFYFFVLAMAALLTGDIVYTMSAALNSAPRRWLTRPS